MLYAHSVEYESWEEWAETEGEDLSFQAGNSLQPATYPACHQGHKMGVP